MANGLPELNTNYGPDWRAIAGMQQVMTQNALARRALEKEMNRENALRTFSKTGDITSVMEADPEFALKLQADQEKRKLETQKRIDEATGKEITRGAQLLAPIIDEADDAKAAVMYQQARSQFYTEYPTSKLKIPEAFSRPAANQMFMQAIPVIEQWKLQNEKPTIENIQVGDQNYPATVTRKGISLIPNAGGPKFKPDTPKRELREVVGPNGQPELSWIEEPGGGTTGGIKPTGATPFKPEKAGKDFEMEDKLRKEFSSESNYYKQVRNAYTTIESAVAKPSAASDVALIYAMVKLFDPPSVVRESEFAVAQKAGGVMDRLEGYLKKAMNGEQLSTDVRKDFAEVARRLYSDHSKQQTDIAERYSAMAKRYNVNPENVVADYSAMKGRKPGTPPGGSTKYDPAALEAELRKRGLK